MILLSLMHTWISIKNIHTLCYCWTYGLTSIRRIKSLLIARTYAFYAPRIYLIHAHMTHSSHERHTLIMLMAICDVHRLHTIRSKIRSFLLTIGLTEVWWCAQRSTYHSLIIGGDPDTHMCVRVIELVHCLVKLTKVKVICRYIHEKTMNAQIEMEKQ